MLGSLARGWGRSRSSSWLSVLAWAALSTGCSVYGLTSGGAGGAGGAGPGLCGDGVKEGAEECDDGNAIDEDLCTANCQKAFCGDGFVSPAELCDPAAPGAMGCTEECTLASCGNGEVEGVEQCDDGNEIDTDECLSTCVHAFCGDGHLREGEEECDDGNNNPDDGCSVECAIEPFCGDGETVSGEGCDEGDDNGDCGSCGATCEPQYVLEASAAVITLGGFDVPVDQPVCWELWEKLPAIADVTQTHRLLTVPGLDPGNVHLQLECRSTAGVQTVAAMTKLGTPQSVVTGPGECADGNWHHIAFCREPAGALQPSLTLFLDGLMIGNTKGVQADDQPLPGAVHLGAPANETALGGRVDELRISSVLRYTTDFEPAARLPAPDADTIAHFRFDDGTGGALFDEVSSSSVVTGQQLTFLPMELFSSPGPLANVCQ